MFLNLNKLFLFINALIMNWNSCKNMFLFSAILCASSYGGNKLMAQKLSLKTNTLTWATLSPNIGAEVIVSSHISVNGHVTFHPFNFKDQPFRFVILQPEVRYWLGRPCSRHFIGITGFYMDNDIVWKDTQYRGDGFAAGASYGYNWVLSSHWNLEASIGAGMMYARQFKYEAGTTRPENVNYKKWLPVPMKCSLSFVYIIK